MRLEKWQMLYVIFPTLILLHLFISPYTKVEESFNIQAIHDILSYGVPTSNVHLKFKALFDHITFPGAVPRTFLGAIILSAIAKPFIWLVNLSGKDQQICVRAVLGLLNATALITFSHQTRKAYGKTTALWYIFLQASQFHILYYASRTLPNTFAFCLSTFAIAALLPVPASSLGPVKRSRLGLYLMTLATVIFRSELALLLGSYGLWMSFKSPTFQSQIYLIRNTFVPAFVAGTIVGLTLTVGIDTYFWQSSTWLWPELSAFLSNVFPSSESLGASAWGTSPWHWYFSNALPRLLMGQVLALVLCVPSVISSPDGRIRDALLPSLIYTTLYSFLPHKETRFLFPIVPLINLAAALFAARSTIRMQRSVLATATVAVLILSIIANFVINHGILLPISAQNYPGGQALQKLHEHHASLPAYHGSHHEIAENPEVRVHLTNLALQSGVTRFLEQPPKLTSALEVEREGFARPLVLPGSPDGGRSALTLHPKPTSVPNTKQRKAQPKWIYDKSSNDTLFLQPSFWSQFDYVVVEDPARVIGAWNIVGEVKSLGQPKLMNAGVERGRLIFPVKDENGPSQIRNTPRSTPMQELVTTLYGNRFGNIICTTYAVLHDILREGAILDSLFGKDRAHSLGLTRGYWLSWGLETKLYILQATYSGVKPNKDRKHASEEDGSKVDLLGDEEEILGLPLAESGGSVQGAGSGASKEIFFDALGPMVVNKDGTLSRIENWKDMTEQEKERTITYLRKRNQIRLDNVEADERVRTE